MTDNSATARQRLLDRAAALNARIGRLEDVLQQPLDDDFAEQATEREDGETLDALEQSALAELAAIRIALRRLDAGVYGICARCGAEIAPERLEALPETAHCIGCAGSTAA